MGSPTETPKEDAYDEHISPLMTQVIALCKEHDINAFATFALDHEEGTDSPLMCTTALPVDDDDAAGADMVGNLRKVVKPEPAFFTSMTITGVPHGE